MVSTKQDGKKSGGEEKTHDKKEKRRASRDQDEKVKEKAKKSKKEKDSIKFTEANKPDIEHIFRTPPRKNRSPQPPPVEQKLTAKERAEQRLLELTSQLKASDIEDTESSCPATDLENFMGCKALEKEKESSSSEGEEEEEDGEEESEEEEDQEGDDKDDEEESPGDEDDQSSEDEDDGEDGGEDETSENENSEKGDEEKEEGEEEGEGEGEGEACENGNEVDPKTHALVPVVDESKKQVANLRNSVSHKREWDTFNRQAKTRMPANLNSMYTASKQDLFNMWMDVNMDWTACSLEVERRHEQKNVSTRGWVAKQGKELRSSYSDDKFQLLVSKRKEQGLYYEDPDFPGDLDEPWMVYCSLCSFFPTVVSPVSIGSHAHSCFTCDKLL